MKKIFNHKEENQNLKFNSGISKINEVLFFSFFISIVFFSLILVLRLFQLSIVKGNYYRNIAEKNRIKEFLIEPKRGEIIDRKGFIIVKNENPETEKNADEVIKKRQRFISKRVYLYPEETAHIIGYRQQANKNDIKNDNCINKINLGDKIGKKGVEKNFECQLRGIPGKKLVEFDAYGRIIKTITNISPKNGKKIQLSIDLDLQKKAYELIKNKKGGIIASIPQTGEILILVSSPSFNPQDFEDEKDQVRNYFNDQNKPLFNRAIEGLYPPGSVFKLITSIAALEEKKIDEKTLIEDTGKIQAGPLIFGNWYYLQYGKTDGIINVVDAIKRSNDIFFYLIGEKTGQEKIKKWAEIFGLGRKTGIGFAEEEGLIPSSFWKETVMKEKWYAGDTYNFSIGQGYLLTTPIQINKTTEIFANQGYYCKPQILKNKKPECKKIPVSEKNLNIVVEGMRKACSSGGTGWPLFDFKVKNNRLIKNKDKELIKIETACKTGTAESATNNKNKKPHAWISVFAPYENPEIVVTVLIEEGGQGSDVAGPIARDILKAYFERTN